MFSKTLFSVALSAVVFSSFAAMADDGPKLGKELGKDELNNIDLTIMPDGRGLPAGSGTARLGRSLYGDQCASCHGADGNSGPAKKLVGPPQHGADWTMGSSWPYAPSIFDYVRRAMPPHSVKELTADELYSITAYLLHLNGLADQDEEMNALTLPKVKMPAAANIHSKWDDVEKHQKEK